ncbi:MULTISPECIES: 4Fe-4S double cluster binding domain-containing protein [unclassified Methanoregula]|uniref:4Fe-4S double cluster binding domain-containing protein n=1 Tax=unclassified Methanoregula TaxID=2649730 RepID=UPI0009CE0484|nr:MULTISPECIES: 4Fe-4S double cluster binding domain-containing protein [unclassified Methanoregula]OPX63212.1 MAG: Epoxyqueuosine reductase [Methanoregula sp. PtaB.Bin085]OPY33512.1 MAG: Epoxyqueuosine reductase [Methanoregula sp. PtaU1.Bin006]
MKTDLSTRIRRLATSLGADYFGIADLVPARDFIRAQGGERTARYPRSVVMGIRLQDSLVDMLPDRDREGAILYRHNSYDVVNANLDLIALRVANILQQEGYGALPVPASKRTSDEHIAGIFSQKLGAHMAGLGWIGRSCLLVTPDHGPRVRWVNVLTDAPLTPTGSPMEPRCGDCTACVDICPVKAFTGRMFSEDEPREARFDAAACDRYFRQLEKEMGVAGVCGLCLWVCPHGRKKKAKTSGRNY